MASTVTLARPLPLDDLHLALGSPDRTGATLTGDPIAVVVTDRVPTDPSDPPTAVPTDAYPRVRVGDRTTTEPGDPGAGVTDDEFGSQVEALRRADRTRSTLHRLPRGSRRVNEEHATGAPAGSTGSVPEIAEVNGPRGGDGTWRGATIGDSA